MCLFKTDPDKAGTEMMGLIWLSFRTVLVAFIALTCVSCSLFPKKELSGSKEERPKVALGILTSLISVNSSLETLYTSVSRGLDESALSKLDKFIVEASEKSNDTREQAELIKSGLDILVDLKSSRVGENEFEEALDSLRTTLVLFNLPTLQFLQLVGRYQLPVGSPLTATLSTADSTLARSLYTFSSIAFRAGLLADDIPARDVPESVRNEAVALELRLTKLKPETFLYLQPYLADAVKIEAPLNESLRDEAQQLFSLAIFKNGLLLVAALQNQKDSGQIDLSSLKKTLDIWSDDVQKKSVAAAIGAPIPTLAVIPDQPPTLAEGTGALPYRSESWEFVLVEIPTLGTVDLNRNPPEYVPTAPNNFSIDRYAFRACLKVIPTFCTSIFTVVVQTPIKPWTLNLKTAKGVSGQFRRGDTLVCIAEIQKPSQRPVYRWTLTRTEPTFSADVTDWETEPGRLFVPNAITLPSGSELDVRESDKISCEVAVRDPNGLQSPFSSPSLATMIATNSPASDIYLTQSESTFEEDENGVPPDSSGDLTCDANSVPGYMMKLAIDDLDSYPATLTIDDCGGAINCPFEPLLPVQTKKEDGRYCAYIKHVGVLNYEKKPFYDLTLRVVDAGTETLSKVVRINVANKNDPITEISPKEITVTENSVLSQILSVHDEDCPLLASCQDAYTYTLGGADAAYFEIDGRTLKSKDVMNYEQFEGPAPSLRSPEYTVTITAKDSENNAYTENVTISVADENEAPTGIVNGVFPLLYENSVSGQVWHTLSIVDPDHPISDPQDPAYDESYQDSVVYTLTMTNSDKNLLTMSGRNIVFGSDNIDFEEFEADGSATLSFVVTATDTGGKSVTRGYEVALLDLNENPTNVYFAGNGDPMSRFIQGSKSDDRNSISPEATLPLQADDPDSDNSFTFQISSINGVPYTENSPSQPFVVDGNSIKPTRVLDFSVVSDRHWTIAVKAVDQGGLESGSVSLNVYLIDITLTNNLISENVLPITIGHFCVNDARDGENCSDWEFSFVSVANPDEQQVFTLDANALKSLMPLNYEERSSYDVLMRAQSTMTEGRYIERSFTINVTNQNEIPDPIVFNPSTPSVDPDSSELFVLAGTSGGVSLGTLLAADEDFFIDNDSDGVADIDSELLTWYKDDDPAASPDSEYFDFIYPTVNNLKRETIEILTKATLPLNRDSFKVTFFVQDRSRSVSVAKTLVFKVVEYPSVSRESPLDMLNRYSADAEQPGSDGLQIDVRIDDDTNTSGCVKATGDEVGLHVINVTNPTHEVISDTGISITEKESGSGYKVCTLTVIPNENAAGEASFDLRVKSSTSVGVIASQSNLNIPVTFWRKPELRCPERVTFPVGVSLSNLQCKIHFNDDSEPADRSLETVSVSGCGLSWADAKLSGSMPSTECSASVTVSGVVNKFGAAVNPPAKTIQLIPRRFGTNGLVRTSVRNPTTGEIFIGGNFTAVDPIPAPGMTAVQTADAHRASECNFTEGFNGPVYKVVYDSANDSFLVGGAFTRYRGQEALRMIRLSCSGEPSGWFLNKGFDGPVHEIVITDDGSVVVGGAFDNYGQTLSKGIVRLSPNGIVKSVYTLLDRSSSLHGVYAISAADTAAPSLWVGGDFPSYGGDVAYKNLVRISLETGANELNQSALFDRTVKAIVTVSGGAIVGGEFSSPGFRLTRLNNAGSVNADFNSGQEFAYKPVHALALDGTAVFVGARGRVAKLNAVSGQPEVSFGNSGVVTVTHQTGSVAAVVNSVLSDGTNLYVGGQFTDVSEIKANHLVSLNASTGALVNGFNTASALNGTVHSMTLFDSGTRLALAGGFSGLHGTPAGRLAAFAPDGVFNSNLNDSLGTGFNGEVRALELAGDDLYVGGSFTGLDGNEDHHHLVKLVNPSAANGTSSVVDQAFDTSADGGFNGEVRSLALAPDNSEKIFVGGSFSSYRGDSKYKALVRLNADGAADKTFDMGEGLSSSGGPVVNALSVTAAQGAAYSIFVGGEFTQYRLEPSARLAKISSTGDLDFNFDISAGFNGPVLVTRLLGSVLYVGGEFTSFRGASANLVALNSLDASVSASANLFGVVRALAIENSELWAGGAFTSHTTSSLARFNLILEATTPVSGDVVLGPRSSAEFFSDGVLNSAVQGVHSLLSFTEVANSGANLRLMLSGYFSLLNGFSGSNSVRVDTTGQEVLADPDTL